MSIQPSINLYLNEPDMYSAIDFDDYPEISGVIITRDDPRCATVDAVVVGLKDVVDDEFLEPFTRMRYVVSNTTGTDHIRTSRDIQVIHLDPSEIQDVSATAEFTLGLLLALVRKIPFIDPALVGDRQAFRGMQLKGKHIGIFGMGRLGKRMARYAEALDMTWEGYDRGNNETDKFNMLKESDIISIHLPLKDETIDFFGEREFASMRLRPFVINTSRPQLVNKPALLHALDASIIAGLAMDFINYDSSDTWDADLRKYHGDKVLLSPHIAGNTHESVAHTAAVVLKKLMVAVRQEPT